MEEKIIIADFTLTKDSCDNFFGEIDLNDTILTYYHNKFIKVYGKAYDFDDKQKSYIKLKFIDMDERQDFFSRDNEGFYEYCDYKDLPDISFEERYDENDNVIEFDEVGEIGEGKIYLEISKISPRSPDFSGKCKIRNCRELDSKNWNVSLDYNFEVIGWYSKKILNDELKINLKINYDEDENCEDWLQESNKTNSYKIKEIINLFASNINLASRGIKFENDLIYKILFHYDLNDEILNNNLINQGYEFAEEIINQKNREVESLEPLIKLEKEKELKKRLDEVFDDSAGHSSVNDDRSDVFD